MYAHLQRVSLSFMDKTEVGRLMSRLQGDVHALQEFLETSVFAIGDFVLLVGIAFVLLLLDWRLGLLTLSVVPILVIVRIVWIPRARRAFLRARITSSTLNGALAEGIHGVRTVQGMGREAVNLRLFEEKVDDNLQAQLRATWLAQIMVPIVDTLTGAAMGIVVVVGGVAVLGERLDLGVMVAFLFYVQRFFDPIRSLTMQYSIMQRAMASGQRIFEVLDVPIQVQDRPGALDPSSIDGSVEFRDVTFGYVRGIPVLRNVSFRVEPGETVALVGPTGSGKTSTMALVHRFYDIWSGQVLVGGHDVRDLTQASLGRHIAMVLQEPFLFTGTVFENIRYATDASREQVALAARAVGAHDFIMRLRAGLRDAARAARRQSVAGPAPADQLCPRPGGGFQDPGARRGHGERRQLHRAADPERARPAARRPHRPGDRASPRDRAQRRSDHRAAERRGDRERHPCRADAPARPLRQALQPELRLVRRHPGKPAARHRRRPLEAEAVGRASTCSLPGTCSSLSGACLSLPGLTRQPIGRCSLLPGRARPPAQRSSQGSVGSPRASQPGPYSPPSMPSLMSLHLREAALDQQLLRERGAVAPGADQRRSAWWDRSPAPPARP